MPRRLSFTRLSLPQQPLVFLALAFLGGLLGAARSHFPLRNWWLIAVIAWACGGVALCLKRTGWWVTVALLVGVLAVGGALWTLNDASAAGDRVRTSYRFALLCRPNEDVARLPVLTPASLHSKFSYVVGQRRHNLHRFLVP